MFNLQADWDSFLLWFCIFGLIIFNLTAYFITKEDGVAYQVLGTYYDKLKKYGDNWLFQDRRIEVEYMTQLNGVIDKMEPMGFDPDS